jgi:hypothetical protein
VSTVQVSDRAAAHLLRQAQEAAALQEAKTRVELLQVRAG